MSSSQPQSEKPILSSEEKAYWEKPFSLKALPGVTPIKDCDVDRGRLYTMICELDRELGNTNKVADKLNQAVQDTMKSVLSQGTFQKWEIRNGYFAGKKHPCSPVTHTTLKNVIGNPVGRNLTWDRRTVFSIWRVFGIDISVDQIFGPRIIMEALPYSVDFRSELIPPNITHWHKIFPQSVKVHNSAITVAYGSKDTSLPTHPDAPFQKKEFTIRMPLVGARLSVRTGSGSLMDNDDLTYDPRSIDGLALSFAEADPLEGEVLAWEIAPTGTTAERGNAPLHAGVIDRHGTNKIPWFQVAVRQQELTLVFRLTARKDHILPVVQNDEAEHFTNQHDILRLAMIARHIRGRDALAEGDVPLAVSFLKLSGPEEAFNTSTLESPIQDE